VFFESHASYIIPIPSSSRILLDSGDIFNRNKIPRGYLYYYYFKERLKIVSTLISSLPNKSYIKDKKAVEEIPFCLETIISEYTVI